MVFCACLGSPVQSTGTVQGCCPLAVAREPGTPWRSHGAGAAGAAPHLPTKVCLRGYPPKPFHEVADAFQHIFDLK